MIEAPRVLIVEDNPGDVRMLRYAFDDDQWLVETTVAEDGEKAIHYLQRHGAFEKAGDPDLVILDLNLPKYGGTAVLKVIRSLSRLRKLPVIILSSSSQEVILKEVRAAGVEADGYFTKPPDFDEFLALAKKIRDCYEMSRRSLPEKKS
ncbi:MAG TPA: response regulator [Bryobacteraceae bacterium]|nr:response regulator [Bryobacteraceae bacterium]